MLTPPHSTDLDLVRGLHAGSSDAFALVYDEYHGAVYNLCARILGDREEAKDVTQDVFLTAFRRPPAATPELRLRPWLYRVATNACLNLVRGRRASGALAEVEALPAVGDSFAQAQSATLIERSLGQLNERYRAALVLKELHGLGGVELAEAMGISRPAADVLVHRARASFKRAFVGLAGEREAVPTNLALALPSLSVPTVLQTPPPLPALSSPQPAHTPPAAPAAPSDPSASGAAPTAPVIGPGTGAGLGGGAGIGAAGGTGLLVKLGAGLGAKAAIVAAGAAVLVAGGALVVRESRDARSGRPLSTGGGAGLETSDAGSPGDHRATSLSPLDHWAEHRHESGLRAHRDDHQAGAHRSSSRHKAPSDDRHHAAGESTAATDGGSGPQTEAPSSHDTTEPSTATGDDHSSGGDAHASDGDR